MNKILIGLLVIGAAAGAFFYLRKKDNPSKENFKQEWIIGTWAVDSIRLAPDDTLQDLERIQLIPDSSYRQYRYEFFNDGRLVKTGSDSSHTYTLGYKWEKEKSRTLTWKKNVNDSAGIALQVVNLGKDSLVLESADKGTVWFIKSK